MACWNRRPRGPSSPAGAGSIRDAGAGAPPCDGGSPPCTHEHRRLHTRGCQDQVEADGQDPQPQYRITVADARTKRDGRAIEQIGKYHPKEEPEPDPGRTPTVPSIGSASALSRPSPSSLCSRSPGTGRSTRASRCRGHAKVKEPKADKRARFDAALGRRPTPTPKSEATTPRKRAAKKGCGKAEAGRGREAGEGRQARQGQGRIRQRPTGRGEKQKKADTARADKPAKADSESGQARKGRHGEGRHGREASRGRRDRHRSCGGDRRRAQCRGLEGRAGGGTPSTSSERHRRPSRRRLRPHPHDRRRGRMLEVHVHPDDLGKVIGRGGRTATAFRTVLGALGGGGGAHRLRRRRRPVGPAPRADTGGVRCW